MLNADHRRLLLMLAGDVETNPGPGDNVDITPLEEDDLFDILELLKDETARWYNIGIALKLKSSALDKIKAETSDSDMCMTKVITNWLKRNYNVKRFGPPTWKALVEAVQATTGGNNKALAEKIAKLHPATDHEEISGLDPTQPRVTEPQVPPSEVPSTETTGAAALPTVGRKTSVDTAQFNIGDVLRLKSEVPEYAALKKYEDELIETLRNVDMKDLIKSAVKCRLVPYRLVSYSKCIDPSLPYPLVCRFLFNCVYTALQTPSETVLAKPFEQLLGLLSDLMITGVTDVLSRMKQYRLSLKKELASRASHSGYMLNSNDIALLAQVLAEFPDAENVVLSLLFPKCYSEFQKLMSLEEVLTLWMEKKASRLCKLPVLQKALKNDLVGLKHLDIAHMLKEKGESQGLLNRVSEMVRGDQLRHSDISLLATVLDDSGCTTKLREIACSLLLPDRFVQVLSNLCRLPAGVMRLTEALTMWITDASSTPRLDDLMRGLNEPAKLKTNLVLTNRNMRSPSEDNEGVKITAINSPITEGNSVLIEIQLLCSTGYPKATEWYIDETLVFTDHTTFRKRFSSNSTMTAIVCLRVKDLMTEGALKCKVKKFDGTSLVSSAIALSAATPLDQYRNVLTTFYTEQPEVPEDTWPPVGSTSYISLALIKQGHIGAGEYYSRSTIRGDIDDIYNDKESIVYDKAFNKLAHGTRLLVEGRPGSGKTTLVHKISRDWAIGNIKFLRNRLLFLVHLRAFFSDPNVGLRDIVKCYYSTDSTIDAIIGYAEKHSGLGLCFILDGLDEYNIMPKNNNCFIFKLIKKEALPRATVIVASRPAAAAKFRTNATSQVEVIGFLKEQIYDYIQKYPFSAASKSDELHKYFDQHPNVLHTCYLPIHSAMICFLFDNLGTALPQTETEIYKEFTKYTILRILFRFADECEEYIESIDSLAAPQKALYKEICRLAYEMTVSSKQVMKQAEMESFFDVKEEKDSLGLVTIDRIATRLGFQKMYTFLHLTFQEFLAACYMSGLKEVEQMELIEKYGKEKQMQQVWKFYCGLVKFCSENLSFDALVGHREYGSLFKVQCCFESQQPFLCDGVVVNNSLSFSDTFLSPSNFTEIAYIISNAQQNAVEQLSFDGCIFGKEEVDALVKKAGDKLDLLNTLCYHKCDTEMLRIVDYFLDSLHSLKMLDVSNSHLQKEKIGALVESRSDLEMIKINSQGNVLYYLAERSLRSQPILAKKCGNHLYRVFSSKIAECLTKKSWPIQVVSREFLLNPENCSEMELLFNSEVSVSVLEQVFMNCHSLATLDFSSDCCLGNNGVLVLAGALRYLTRLSKLDISSNYLSKPGVMAICEGLKCSHSLLELNISTNQIIDIDGAAALVEMLMQCTNLERLDVSSNCLCNDSARVIAEGLKHCSCLLELNVSSNHLGIDGAKVLAEVLMQCIKLEKLDVSSNFICNDGAEAIAEGLKHCPSLRHFNISSNYIGISGAKALAGALEHCSCLQDLMISSNGIKSEGVKVFADCIKNWTGFCTLDISSNSVQSDGAKALAVALEQAPSFCKLYIGNNKIRDDGLQYLSSALRKCTTLSALDISSNDISVKGFKENVDAFKNIKKLNISDNNLYHIYDDFFNQICSHKSLGHISASHISDRKLVSFVNLATLVSNSSHLRKLDISNNAISNACKTVLAISLKSCVNLHELNISNNNLSSKDCSAFADCLKKFADLSVFSASLNNIGGTGIKALASGLIHCANLHELHINNTDIGDSGARVVANIIKHCRKLQMLHVAGNDITSDGADVLVDAMNQDKMLTELDISDNKLSRPLKSYTRLEILHMNYNAFKIGASGLAGSLKFCTSLRELHLRNSVDYTSSACETWPISDSSCGILANTLVEHCKDICVLDISDNVVSDDGISALANVLKQCTYLKDLKLSLILPLDPIIIERRKACLLNSLQHYSNLYVLDISDNYLDNRDVKTLSCGLIQCRRLLHLYIGNNRFDVGGVLALANVVEHCSVLQTLDLSGNPIGDEGAVALARVLQHNTTLSTLCVHNCDIRACGAKALIKTLQHISFLDIDQQCMGEECTSL